MIWNVEGFKRNISNTKYLLDQFEPDFVFLSETQLYDCDSNSSLKYFEGEYCYYLNSTDKFDVDLPLIKAKAWGGTMAL